MPVAVKPLAVQAGEGNRLETPTGDTVTVKLDTAATNGTLSVLELLIAPQSGPALHTHLREDELWYVLDGSSGSRRTARCCTPRPAGWPSGRVAWRTLSKTSARRPAGF